MTVLTITQVSGMSRGTYVIGKKNEGRGTMSRMDWIIIELHATKVFRKGLFDWGTLCNIEWEDVDKLCMYGACS